MSQFKTPEKGAALLTLLMVVVVAVILLFTLAGASIFHLNVAGRTDSSYQARNLAESVVAQGIYQVIKDVEYGDNRDKTLALPQNPGRDEPWSALTFNEAEARQRDIPFSTNNINNDAAVEGWNHRVVPKNSIHLVGSGTCNGVTRNVEAIIHIPPFPYSIAASGKFTSSGTLLVASVQNPDDVMANPDEVEYLPGHLLSNSNNTEAVTLDGEAEITGDLQTAGDVKIEEDADVKILGEVRCREAQVNIPKINLASYDPQHETGVHTMAVYEEDPELEGYWRSTETVDISGDLNLQGALLYVDGDLNISGGIKGKGAVVVTGRTTIAEGSDLATDNLVALLSRGDVSLGGAGNMDSSSLQGVVYTEGDFTADSVSLFGVVITNSETGGDITLNNSKMVHLSEYTDVEIDGNTATEPEDPGGEFDETLNMALDIDGTLHVFKVSKQGSDDCTFTCGTQQEWADGNEHIFSDAARMYDYMRTTYSLPAAGPEMFSIQARVTSMMQQITLMYEQYVASQDGETEEPTVEEIFSMNLSKFLNIEDRMRILLWRQF